MRNTDLQESDDQKHNNANDHFDEDCAGGYVYDLGKSVNSLASYSSYADEEGGETKALLLQVINDNKKQNKEYEEIFKRLKEQETRNREYESELDRTKVSLEEHHARVLELEKFLRQDTLAKSTTTSRRKLKENEESFDDDYQVDTIGYRSFRKTQRSGVNFLSGGVTSLNEDTYNLMILSKGFRTRAWFLGFIVFLSQVFLCGLTIYSQLNATSNKFGNYTPLDIPIRTRRDVTALQFFAIIIAVYSQDDMFNAIALPIDLRLNGPNPWGGIPVTEVEKGSRYIWMKKILLPNAMKGIAGMLVLLTSVMVILQSEEVIDLLMNFTALFVISYIDNVVFSVVRRGFFGVKLQYEAILAQEVDISPKGIEAGTKGKGSCNDTHLVKSLILNLFLVLYLTIWAIVLYSQESGWMARQKFPECQEEVPVFNTKWPLLQNDNCDMLFNNVRCGYDGGDCEGFNALYPDCKVEDTFLIANGKCDGFPYNSVECRFDGGDCRRDALYCDSSKLGTIGDGICDEDLNTHECFFDRGDCIDKNLRCEVLEGGAGQDDVLAIVPGDGICGVPKWIKEFGFSMMGYTLGGTGTYSGRDVCSFDGGDCLHPRYPDCYFDDNFPNFLEEIGDGICQNYNPYNTKECNFDGGDCLGFNEKYPECKEPNPERIGDGICDVEYNVKTCGFDEGDCCEGLRRDNICEMIYNIEECGFDGGDCLEFNQEFPNCEVGGFNALIRNGICEKGSYNTKECGFDGGDCLEFNEKFPDCEAPQPYSVGNSYCNGLSFNTPECGWDGGDCLEFNKRYPNCTHVFVPMVGDGICDGLSDGILYNVEECGWDGGDCLEFNAKYPDCKVMTPKLVGNGICDGSLYDKPECGWDGGDCLEFNEQYPDCKVNDPSLIGNGQCDKDSNASGEYFVYNTAECNWDGLDCIPENYPDCKGLDPENVGNGYCDGGAYNTEDCGWDGGDCVNFNEMYPNCVVNVPLWIGNNHCDGGDYNTEQCGFDAGDCEEFNAHLKEKLPTCNVEKPSWVGDGYCDKLHNTVECGFDDGDCVVFNAKYPNCDVDEPFKVGDGECNGSEYNVTECEWDGGDCV